jgi:hypothetical protein
VIAFSTGRRDTNALTAENAGVPTNRIIVNAAFSLGVNAHLSARSYRVPSTSAGQRSMWSAASSALCIA